MMIIHPSKHGSKFNDVVYTVDSSAVTAKQPAGTEGFVMLKGKLCVHTFRSYDVNVMW
jgi:hypothetical protein